MQEGDDEGFNTIKKCITDKGRFVMGFRSLIFLGRQNLSHRTLLEIEIMKAKCYAVEKVHKGGKRMCSSLDVIKFEESMIKFMKNFLTAAEMSISILKFMQSKEGRKETLAEVIRKLIDILIDNQQLIR